jgi:predicted MFS family arabinose efflux permease
MGLGIASPIKNSLFATHLDKNKETTEWGIYDAVTFVGMASTAALGGFIASSYGFNFLFVIAAIVNFIGILPYLLYIRHK